MKKFSKLLAVVLALAVIICPMMSAMSVSADASAGTYKMEKVSETELKLTISSTNGFLVYQAAIAFTDGNLDTSATGYTNGVKLIDYTLVSKTKDAYNLPNVSVNLNGTTLNVLVASTDANCLDLYSSVVIGLAVSKGTTATLSKIQAADEGDGQTTTSDATLLAFPAAGEDGTIDPTANDYPEADVSANAHTCAKVENPTADSDNLKTAATHASGNVYWDTCATCGAQLETYWEDTSSKIAHAWSYTSNSNGTHNATCSGCTETITNEACDTTGTDGACSKCGYKATSTEPVEDARLTVNAPSLAFGNSSLELSFRVKKSVYEEISEYADTELVIVPSTYDLDTLNLVANPKEIVIKGKDLEFYTSKTSQYIYKEMRLYELGLNIKYYLRAYDSKGNYVAKSIDYNTSPVTELKSLYDLIKTSNPKMVTLITDLLIVGQKAMDRMTSQDAYKDTDLAHASSILTDIDLTKATQSMGTLNNINELTSEDNDYLTTKGTLHRVTTSSVIDKVPYVVLRVLDKNQELDLSKISVKVTYTSVDGAGTSHPYEQTCTILTTPKIVRNGNQIELGFDQVGLHDVDKTISFEFSYDGQVKFVQKYSVETLCGELMAYMPDFCEAIVKLGASFRAYSSEN